jgi:hypothetical protein
MIEFLRQAGLCFAHHDAQQGLAHLWNVCQEVVEETSGAEYRQARLRLQEFGKGPQTAQVIGAVIESETTIRAERNTQAFDFGGFAALRQSDNNRASAHELPRWIRFARLMAAHDEMMNSGGQNYGRDRFLY